MPPKPKPVTERLWAHVDRPIDGCWLSTHQARGNGYAAIHRGGLGSPKEYVHRLAWEEASGQPVPDGFEVCHTCDTRLCIRNDQPGVYELDGKTFPRFGHLYLGKHANNTADARAKGRLAAGDRHGRRVLTAAQVEEVRRRRAKGESIKALAEELGVHKTTLYYAVSGHTWSHSA